MANIFGGVTSINNPRTNWAQTDSKKADYLKNKPSVANALEGYKSGAIISADDVSPIEHELDVKVRSKNIIPITYSAIKGNANDKITYTINADGSITVRSHEERVGETYSVSPWNPPGDHEKVTSTFGIIGTNGASEKLDPYLEDGENYMFSAEVVENKGEILPDVVRSGHDGESGIFSRLLGTTGVTVRTFIVNKSVSKYYGIFIHMNKNMIGKIIDCTIKVQLEKGEVATPITPSIDVDGVNVTVTDGESFQTATADADGNVTGLVSMSPTMTLTTDNEGAVIDCTYNRDANKVITDLETKLNTLIATIGG